MYKLRTNKRRELAVAQPPISFDNAIIVLRSSITGGFIFVEVDPGGCDKMLRWCDAISAVAAYFSVVSNKTAQKKNLGHLLERSLQKSGFFFSE